MGNVIPFRRSKVYLPTLAEQLSSLSAELSVCEANLTAQRSCLIKAAEEARRVLEILSASEDFIQQTLEFCDKCFAAGALGNLEEMVRARDELSGVMRDERNGTTSEFCPRGLLG